MVYRQGMGNVNVLREERPMTVGEKQTGCVILEVSPLQPTSSHLSWIIQQSFTWLFRRVHLTEGGKSHTNYVLNGKYALNSEQRLTTSFYGIIIESLNKECQILRGAKMNYIESKISPLSQLLQTTA